MNGQVALRTILIASVFSIVASCGYDTPGSPSGSLTGTWTGAATETGLGTGTARLVLEQNGMAVNGTFTTTFAGVANRDGAVSGTVMGSTVTLGFTPATPLVCGPNLTLGGTVGISLTSSTYKLVGSYSSFTCGGAITGSVDLARP